MVATAAANLAALQAAISDTSLQEVILLAADIDVTSGITVGRNIVLAAERPVSLRRDSNFTGNMFTVNNGRLTLGREDMRAGTLVIDGNNIYSTATGYLVFIAAGGSAALHNGVILKNNNKREGAAIYLAGNLLMDGGEISDNTSTNGAGLRIASGGVFTMTGGIIQNNTATNDTSYGDGGGIYILLNGTFTMSGGLISGNRSPIGGGVMLTSTGTFNLDSPAVPGPSGSVRDNTAPTAPNVRKNTGAFNVDGVTWTGGDY